jgi:hypothetical protein
MGTNITATGLYGDNCMSATLKIGGIFDIPGFTKTSAINIRVTGGSVMSNYFGVSNGKDCIELNDGIGGSEESNLGCTLDGFTCFGNDATLGIELHEHGNDGYINRNVTLKNGLVSHCDRSLWLRADHANNRFYNLTIEDVEIEAPTMTNRIFQASKGTGINVTRLLMEDSARQGCTFGSCEDVIITDPDLIDTSAQTSNDVTWSGIYAVSCTNIQVLGAVVKGWAGPALTFENSTFTVADSTRTTNLFNNSAHADFGSAIKLIGSGAGCSITGGLYGNDSGFNTRFFLTYVSGYDDLEIDGVEFQNLSVGALNGTFEGTNVVVTNCDEMEDLPFTEFTEYTYLNDYFNELVYRGVKLPNSTVRTAMDDFFDNMGTTLRGAVVESHFAFGGGRDQCVWNALNPAAK